MSRPLLPPRGIFIPSTLLYDRKISPAVRDTWSQLRGLAWGQISTPPLTYQQIIEMTGKSQSTLFEHMRLLRITGALQWRSAGSATLIISFPEDDWWISGIDSENSEVLDLDLNRSMDRERFKRDHDHIGFRKFGKNGSKTARKSITCPVCAQYPCICDLAYDPFSIGQGKNGIDEN